MFKQFTTAIRKLRVKPWPVHRVLCIAHIRKNCRADFRENEVSESAEKKTNPRKKIRPNLFLKRQLKLMQTASKLQP